MRTARLPTPVFVIPAIIEAESLIHSDGSRPRTHGLWLISVEVELVIGVSSRSYF